MPRLARMQYPAFGIADQQRLRRHLRRPRARPTRRSVTSVAFQVAKNQSPLCAYSRRMRPTVWRKLTASRIASVVSAAPLAPSIIAAEISFEAMIGIKRRRRRMHHERLVEARMLDRIATVTNVNERRLRKRSQQLVRRMRGEHCRPASVGCGVAEHRVTARVQRVETRVGVPRLVEVQAVDRITGDLDDSLDVVDESVVGRVRDDGVARLQAVRGSDERVLLGVLAHLGRLQDPPGR